MVQSARLTLKDFLAMPEGDVAHEFIDGKTVFQPKAVPITYRGNTAISEPQLPELEISAQIIFDRAGLAG